jgi:hypothetical protein
MNKPAAAVICFLFLCTTIAVAAAQTNTITPTDLFPIPQLHSQIQFAENLNYTSAAMENNTWYFTGLKAGGYAGFPIRGHLHILARDCNLTVIYLQAWTQPEIGTVGLQWIKYNATGAGTQTLDGNDLFPNSDKWTEWTVKVNGEKQLEGQSWNITSSKQLTISTEGESFVEVSVMHTPPDSDTAPLPPPAPAQVNFTPVDSFPMPQSNGSLCFAVGGSYDTAILAGENWVFTNLTLNNYAINAGMFAPNVTGRDVLPYIFQFGYPADLFVSAKDSNLTITGITPLTWHSFTPALTYTVQGAGSQIITLPFQLSRFNWTVTIDGVQKQEGDGWSIQDNNQVKVTSAKSNVTIIGNYIEPPSPRVNLFPVYQIIAVILVAATIAIIAFVLYRRQRVAVHGSTRTDSP